MFGLTITKQYSILCTMYRSIIMDMSNVNSFECQNVSTKHRENTWNQFIRYYLNKGATNGILFEKMTFIRCIPNCIHTWVGLITICCCKYTVHNTAHRCVFSIVLYVFCIMFDVFLDTCIQLFKYP